VVLLQWLEEVEDSGRTTQTKLVGADWPAYTEERAYAASEPVTREEGGIGRRDHADIKGSWTHQQ